MVYLPTSPFATAAVSCFCNLNLPHYACPHCGESFLDNARRSALVAQVLEELRRQVAKEEEQRNRAIEEARKAEGAFPMLPGASGTQGACRPAGKGTATGPQSSHKVLSLNSTTKKKNHVGSLPLQEISYVKQPPDPEHSWKNMQFPDLQYIPPSEDLNTHGG
ncbi:hypothetical protein EDC04DRAFT_2966252 [Pisolithus marmoratus]|nr:hypothetical protein EDC04DRAFT_2966252 [Pisolithus marmoratus]